MIPCLLIVSKNALNELIWKDSFSSERQTALITQKGDLCLPLNIRDL